MGRSIPDEVIEEIRLRSDIVEVIGSYIPLKRAGGNSWKACCPFHQEKTPSFHVRGDKQVFHCFGCGKGGDVFRFVMERENVPFPEAAHLLASRCGVVIPEQTTANGSREQGRAAANVRDRLYQLQEEFARFFENNLKKHPDWPASRYLATRALPPDIITRFRLGAAPDAWDGCLRYGRALGFSDEEMLTGGIIRRSDTGGRLYDHFRGRLTFAIWNEQGKVVGFSARSLEAHPQTAKYVNTAETPIFKKSQLLYALPFARKAMQDTREAILCEGQLDTIALHRAGLAQAVAPQGTGFTVEQARILRRYVDRVQLAFDADQAGQKAIRSALELLLPLEFEIGVIRIPGGKDPDELFRSGGAEAVTAAAGAARPWTVHLAESCATRYDLTHTADRGRAVGEFIDLLGLVENPVLRELYARDSAALLNVSENAILGELNRRRKLRTRRFAGSGMPQQTTAPAISPTTSSAATDREQAELTLLELSLGFERAARQLAEQLPPEWLGNTPAARALNRVLADTMNGEHAHAAAAVAAMLAEEPMPAISRILASECSFSEKNLDKALKDCLAVLRARGAARNRKRIIEELRHATDPQEKLRLLALLAQKPE